MVITENQESEFNVPACASGSQRVASLLEMQILRLCQSMT